MKTGLLVGLLISSTVMADDYSEGRDFALQSQSGVIAGMKEINPHELLNEFNEHPAESRIDPMHLREEAKKKASTDETAQHIITSQKTREKVDIDLNSEELRQAGTSIETAEDKVKEHQVPCSNGSCLPTPDVMGDDFADGITQLGALSNTADEVSAKQIRSGNPSIFTGTNSLCRIAVAGVGNCCGGHARLLNCRDDEKNLAEAILAGRAQYVGTYCAHHKKIIGCIEYKQSWCTFASKLASIIQIQGRGAQLGITFGWASHRTNAANCRGISPEELERINFQALPLGELTESYQTRATLKNTQQIDTLTTQKIEALEERGLPHD